MRHRPLADGRNSPRLWLLGLAVLALSAAAAGRVPAEPDKAFVGDHCTGCHNAEDKKGRLDLTSLAFDPKDPANLAVWVRVHDRVAAGEMPPKSRPRPDAAAQKAFVEGLAKSIVAAERAALAGEGRATLRRLNRHEYENALRDLLGVPWAQVANRLPEDGEAHRFNKSGEALDVSYLTMERFLDSANHALRLATATGLERPAKTTRKLYARDEPSLRNWWPRENGTLPDRLSFPVLDSQAQPDVRAGRARRPARRPASARRSARCRASSATRAGTAGTAGGRRPRPATRCGSPATRSGSPAAAWPGGSSRARGPRRRRCTTRCCGTARTWTRSTPASGTSRSASTRPAAARRARSARSTSRRSRPSARSRCSCCPARSSAPTARGCSGRGSTAPTSSTSTRWRPRTACPATPSSGSRSKGRSTTTRSAGRATGCCSTN